MSRTPTSVLLIEDNGADAALIRETLRDAAGAGFAITHVDRLSSAKASLSALRPDVILVDLGLPDADGLGAFRVLHSMVSGIPIVVLSGQHDDELALQAVSEGAQDYLSKDSINSELLARTLRHAVQRTRSEERLRVIAQAVSAETGERFFRTLVEHLASVLQVDYVFLCEIGRTDPRRAIALAAWGPNGLVEGSEWHVADDPALPVLAGQSACHARGLGELFPRSPLVRKIGAEAYLAVPLFGPEGTVIGVLEAVHSQEIAEPGFRESILRIFAARAGAELSRLHAAAAVEEWKGRYEAVLLANGQILYDWDSRADTIVWGGNSVEMLGYTVQELSAEIHRSGSWLGMVHPDDRAAVETELDRAVANRDRFHAEYRIRHKDGHYLPVEDTGYFCQDATGARTRLIGTISDMSERKRMEEQLRHSQKMDAIGQLAGGLAHDFRNLLMVMHGHLSLAKTALSKDHAIQDSLDQIAEAAHQAAGITNALLTFTHKSPTLKQPVQLAKLVEQSAKLFRRSLPSSITLDVQAAGCERWINADALQIQQAIMNLAINAADAMPKGGTLTLLVDEAPAAIGAEDGARSVPGVRLIVRDTGTGMPPGVKDRIFEPYFTTKPRGQGTGLGLSITHSIVKEHGGRTRVESAVGVGTTFTIVFPAVEPAALRREVDRGGAKLGAGKTAIVSGNHPLIRSVVGSMLVSTGFRVIQTAGGEACVRRLDEADEPIALAVLDLDSGGDDPAAWVARVRHHARSPDVLVITSRPERIEADSPGIGILQKPFQMGGLQASLAEFGLARTPVAPER